MYRSVIFLIEWVSLEEFYERAVKKVSFKIYIISHI